MKYKLKPLITQDNQLEDHDYYSFVLAAEKGHLKVFTSGNVLRLNKLKKTPYLLFEVFNSATENKHIDEVNWLKNEVKNELPQIIQAGTYILSQLCARGYVHVFNWLKEDATDELQEQIKKNGLVFLSWATRGGSIVMLNWLKQEFSESQLQEINTGDNSLGLELAATNGHLCVFNWWKEVASNKTSEVISEKDYKIFSRAFGNGRIKILNFLKQEFPEKLSEMISKHCENRFQYIVVTDRIASLNWLKQEDYDTFRRIMSSEYSRKLVGLKSQIARQEIKVSRGMSTWLEKEERNICQNNPNACYVSNAEKIADLCDVYVNRPMFSHDYQPKDLKQLATEMAYVLRRNTDWSRDQCREYVDEKTRRISSRVNPQMKFASLLNEIETTLAEDKQPVKRA